MHSLLQAKRRRFPPKRPCAYPRLESSSSAATAALESASTTFSKATLWCSLRCIASFTTLLTCHLAAKGIDRDTAVQAVEELYVPDEQEDPELANACALVERHYAAKLADGKWQQVAAALARRGFSHAVIRQALDRYGTE